MLFIKEFEEVLFYIPRFNGECRSEPCDCLFFLPFHLSPHGGVGGQSHQLLLTVFNVDHQVIKPLKLQQNLLVISESETCKT